MSRNVKLTSRESSLGNRSSAFDFSEMECMDDGKNSRSCSELGTLLSSNLVRLVHRVKLMLQSGFCEMLSTSKRGVVMLHEVRWLMQQLRVFKLECTSVSVDKLLPLIERHVRRESLSTDATPVRVLKDMSKDCKDMHIGRVDSLLNEILSCVSVWVGTIFVNELRDMSSSFSARGILLVEWILFDEQFIRVSVNSHRSGSDVSWLALMLTALIWLSRHSCAVRGNARRLLFVSGTQGCVSEQQRLVVLTPEDVL